MIFSSITFLTVFLPLVLVLYFLCFRISIKVGNLLLLVFSVLFYAWGEPKYVFLMLASIVVNYCFGLQIAKHELYKKTLLCIGILCNLSVLFYFKYLGFATGLVNNALQLITFDGIGDISIIMPIGISFYTFQSISYLVDVYRNKGLVQNNLLNLGLYISFFPQLIAGPIIRYHDINEQFVHREHSVELFADGIKRFIIGLGKKVLLANNLAEVCDKIISMPYDAYGTYYAWIAIICYSLQIYYDFSGYSDMAIGLGKMFGFNFLENFNYPYAASSMTDFWRRWHISLSNWFKDYVYIPLGGGRCSNALMYRNLYIVFFLTGLWHGASFNFIVWGLGHGTLLFIEKGLSRSDTQTNNVLLNLAMRIYTLLSVMLLLVFFRIETLTGSVAFIFKLFNFNYYMPGIKIENSTMLDIIVARHVYIFLFAGLLLAFPWWRKLPDANNTVKSCGYILLLFIFVLVLAKLASGSYNPFIYFRF